VFKKVLSIEKNFLVSKCRWLYPCRLSYQRVLSRYGVL